MTSGVIAGAQAKIVARHLSGVVRNAWIAWLYATKEFDKNPFTEARRNFRRGRPVSKGSACSSVGAVDQLQAHVDGTPRYVCSWRYLRKTRGCSCSRDTSNRSKHRSTSSQKLWHR